MGTREKPGTFDCYSAAAPDEPMFVLLARDPSASLLVGLWALIREETGEDPEKVEEARGCADAMQDWLAEHADEKKIEKAKKIAELWAKFDFGALP